MAPPSSGFAYPPRCHGPVPQPRDASIPVWPGALSLATTRAVSVISFPRGTEMFHFPRCSSSGTIFVHPRAPRVSARRVSPFGHPRIKARWRLPAAFRSLPRPSSPHGAKASVVRPYTLSKIEPRLSLRCNSLQLQALDFQRPTGGADGGPDRSRTCDLVLIRDAL